MPPFSFVSTKGRQKQILGVAFETKIAFAGRCFIMSIGEHCPRRGDDSSRF